MEEKRLEQNERIRLWYQANKERLQARRRELYAQGGNQRDREYYLKKRDTPEYKERMRETMRRWREGNRPADYDKETARRTKNRKIGATLARQSKKKVIKKKESSWMDSIPDLSQPQPSYDSVESPRVGNRGVLALLYG